MLNSLSKNIRRRYLLVLLVVFLTAYAFWLLLGQDQRWDRFWIGHLTMVFTSGIAAQAAWSALQKMEHPARQKAWRWIALAFSLWLVHAVLLMVSELSGFPTWLRHLTTGTYVIGIFALWIGLVQVPYTPRVVYGRMRLYLDIALTSAALLTLLWVALFQPIIGLLNLNSLPSALYIIADLFTLLIIANMFLLSEIERISSLFGWVIVAILAFTFSDMGYVALAVYQVPYEAGNLLDVGWIVGDLFLLMAIQSQVSETRVQLSRFFNRVLYRTQSLLPIVATLVLAWYTLVNWQLSGDFDLLGLWATLALGLGLLLRQGILAGEIALEQYARLVNSIAEPAFVCNRQGRLQMLNPAFLEISGYQRSDLIGKPLIPLLAFPQGKENWLREIIEDSQDEDFSGTEKEGYLITRTGESIPVMLALRPVLPSNRRQLALAGTAHDLRLQKQQQARIQMAYEEVAEARAELERLNQGLEQLVNEKTADLQTAYQQLEEQHKTLQQLDQLKSDFVSLVSHELRAPLTNIRGGIELLLINQELSPQKTASTLQRVNAEILRLSQFTETILDLSALDANRLPLYPEPLDVNHAVLPLQNHFQQVSGTERIAWQIPRDLPPVLADEKALYSILFHLVDNALKYAPEGEIIVTAAAGHDHIRIWVADEGPGIPEDALPLLFERFYRARMDDAQTTYGHGLGLYLVRRFVEAMQGSVDVANRPEGGAVFSIQLPGVEVNEPGSI